MTFDTPREARDCVPFVHINRKRIQMYTITAIIRPEHYVLPVKHPPNCRCTQHGGKTASPVPSISSLLQVRIANRAEICV